MAPSVKQWLESSCKERPLAERTVLELARRIRRWQEHPEGFGGCGPFSEDLASALAAVLTLRKSWHQRPRGPRIGAASGLIRLAAALA